MLNGELTVRGAVDHARQLPPRLVGWLLWGYRAAVSPYLGPCCRFVPSCSQYAGDAMRKYGPVRGGLKAAWRLARCNPWSRGGVDFA